MLKFLIYRPSRPTSLAMVYASQGRYTNAADVIETALKIRGELDQGQTLQWRTAAQLLRIAPAKPPMLHMSVRPSGVSRFAKMK